MCGLTETGAPSPSPGLSQSSGHAVQEVHGGPGRERGESVGADADTTEVGWASSGQQSHHLCLTVHTCICCEAF